MLPWCTERETDLQWHPMRECVAKCIANEQQVAGRQEGGGGRWRNLWKQQMLVSDCRGAIRRREKSAAQEQIGAAGSGRSFRVAGRCCGRYTCMLFNAYHQACKSCIHGAVLGAPSSKNYRCSVQRHQAEVAEQQGFRHESANSYAFRGRPFITQLPWPQPMARHACPACMLEVSWPRSLPRREDKQTLCHR